VERYGESWTDPDCLITNGPFRLQQWVEEESMTFARHDAYLGPRRGNVDQVELLLVPSSDWRHIRALELYEADLLDSVALGDTLPQEMWERARQKHAREYASFPVANTQYLALDTRRAPLDDVRVRRALALSLDKDQLVDAIASGRNFPAKGGFIPPGMVAHSPDIGLPHDPDQARRMLAEAGYAIGRGFPRLQMISNRSMERCGQEVQAQWRAHLGIDVESQAIEWDELLQRWHSDDLPLLAVLGWVGDYPDPDAWLRASDIRTYGRWQNELFDRLVEDGRRVMDQAARVQLYQRADRILMAEASVVPLLHVRLHVLQKPYVTNWPTTSIAGHLPWKDLIIWPH
jgi:oligopeptide transport system substrate-binding protein